MRAEAELAHRVIGASAHLLAGVEHRHLSLGQRSAQYSNFGSYQIVQQWLPTSNTNALLGQERLVWGGRAAVGAGLRYERDWLVGDTRRIYPTADGTLRLISNWLGGGVHARAAYGEAPQRVGPCSPTVGSDPEINDLPRAAVSRSILTGIPLPRRLLFRIELEYGAH